MVVERLNQCENIVELAKERSVSRRLLYPCREKLEPLERGGPVFIGHHRRGPKYLFSSLLTCAHCGHKFIIVDSRHYGCGGWQYRGQSVCSNTIKVSRAIVELVLLSAIQRDLFTEEGFMVFKQDVARLLAERRRTQIPDREWLHAKLAEVLWKPSRRASSLSQPRQH